MDHFREGMRILQTGIFKSGSLATEVESPSALDEVEINDLDLFDSDM